MLQVKCFILNDPLLEFYTQVRKHRIVIWCSIKQLKIIIFRLDVSMGHQFWTHGDVWMGMFSVTKCKLVVHDLWSEVTVEIRRSFLADADAQTLHGSHWVLLVSLLPGLWWWHYGEDLQLATSHSAGAGQVLSLASGVFTWNRGTIQHHVLWPCFPLQEHLGSVWWLWWVEKAL